MDTPSFTESKINELYKKGKRAFFSYARNWNLDYEILEDIYQESFIVFIENIKKGAFEDKGASMLTYLIGICRINLLKFYGKNQRIIFEPLSPTVSEVADYYTTNEEKKEVLDTMMQLLEETEDNCRRILILFYRDKKNMTEIAEVLQYKNEGVAKNKKSSCLRRFRYALKERLSRVGINWRTKDEK